MEKIKIFTIQFCPYCVRAKELLKKRGIPYDEEMISEDDDAIWDELYKRSGMKTVPQIFHGNKLIGGYTELAELDREDQLNSLKR